MPLADDERVARAVVERRRHVLAAGGHRDLVVDPAARHDPVREPGGAGPQRPVGVLGVEEELGVEVADLLEHGARDEHRGAAGAVRLPRLRLGRVVRLAVANVAPVAPARIEARAGEPDPVAGLEVEDLRAEGARVRPPPRLLDERADEPRLDLDVVVEHEHVVGAALQRVPDADVVPLREAEVLLRADELGLGKPLAHGLGGAVAGAVVDHDHVERLVLDRAQRREAAERVVAAVPGEHDDRDAGAAASGRAHASGALRSPRRRGRAPPARRATRPARACPPRSPPAARTRARPERARCRRSSGGCRRRDIRRGPPADLDAEPAPERLGDVEHADAPSPCRGSAPVDGRPGSSAAATPATMSQTCTKSRFCTPSSNTTGGWPSSRREEKIAATPVYGFESACREP